MSDTETPALAPRFQTTGLRLHWFDTGGEGSTPSAVRCNPVHDVTSYAATSSGIWIAHRTYENAFKKNAASPKFPPSLPSLLTLVAIETGSAPLNKRPSRRVLPLPSTNVLLYEMIWWGGSRSRRSKHRNQSQPQS